MKLERFDEAEEALFKGLILNPSNEEILADYAKVIATKDVAQAIVLLEDYGEDADLNGESRLLLVKLYWMSGRQSDALLLYKDLVFSYPSVAKKLFLHFEEAQVIPQFIQLFELIEEN